MRTKLLKSSAAGFTLIELIVVMVMIGVLFSIAAPGWLAFANRQRVNSVRDELLQEIRRTQTVAAQTRLNQEFTVIPETANTRLSVQVAPSGTPVGSQARELGNGQIQPGVIQFQSTNNIRSIEFDDKGNIVSNSDLPADGLKFTISLASNPNVKSCAIVQTLLGATRSGRGEECN